MEDPEDVEAPWGLVPVEGRGSLPFALVHGESLVAAASWALTAAGAELFDLTVPWEQVQESGRDLVVHDPLCPLTPADVVVEAVDLAKRTGAVVVGVRPVTDTVKVSAPDAADHEVHLGATVDREGLLAVASPLVLPAEVVAASDAPDTSDLPALVTRLAQRWPVRTLPVPALGRRITSTDDLAVLAALSAVSRAPGA